MRQTRQEQTDHVLQDFMKNIKNDSEIPGLPLPEQKELWNRIDHKNKSYDRRYVRLLIWSGSVAASICLFILVGQHMFSPSQIPVDYVSVMQSFGTVDYTSGNVQLVLSSNRKIAIEGKETQLDYEEEGWVNINKNEKMDVTESEEDEKAIYNQLVTPVGKYSILTFNDGTRIWLNSGTKLVYPIAFEKHKRDIYVEGEIYLDVSPDPERPFTVYTSTLDVKVLGTQFNVSAYPDQSGLQVVLVSGKVEIQQNGHSKGILKPNQLFSYNEERKEFSTSTVDVSDYIAWKDGYYSFHRQDLGIVLTKLSKYYNVQFNWDEKIKELSCSGKLDLKENVQEVLNILVKTAPVEIRKTSEREYTVIIKP